jgi:4-hydroxy-tetrahydrodipicolinate synthase
MTSLVYSANTVPLADKPAVAAKIRGTGTAIVTPFAGENAERVDVEGLKNLVDSQIAGGIDFIVPVGTTGECPTLSHEEHEMVIKTVVDRVAGRIPVVAGTGSNNTTEAISLTKFAKDCGADAVLMVNPYYNKPNQTGLFLHFQAVAAAVDIPIVLYNIPSRTGITMQPETVAKLWNEIPNIVAIKEATGSLEIASKIRALCPIPIVSGDDTLTLPLMSIGGCGVISVLSNVAPGLVKSIVDSANAGKWTEAANNHCRLHRLMGTMFIDTNPVPVKEAAQVMGIIGSAQVRLPMAPIEPAKRVILMDCLKEYKLIE